MWKRKSKSAPFLFPPELVPESVMSLTRWREYALMLIADPRLIPEPGVWENWPRVQPGDTVEVVFFNWGGITFHIHIREDWDEFDKVREEWKEEVKC